MIEVGRMLGIVNDRGRSDVRGRVDLTKGILSVLD